MTSLPFSRQAMSLLGLRRHRRSIHRQVAECILKAGQVVAVGWHVLRYSEGRASRPLATKSLSPSGLRQDAERDLAKGLTVAGVCGEHGIQRSFMFIRAAFGPGPHFSSFATEPS